MKSTLGGHMEGMEIAERTVVEVDRSTRVEAHVTYEGHVIVVEENTLEVHGATGIMNHGSAVHTTGVLDHQRKTSVVGTERHIFHVLHVAVLHVEHAGAVGLHGEDIYVINVTLAHVENGSTSDGKGCVLDQGDVLVLEVDPFQNDTVARTVVINLIGVVETNIAHGQVGDVNDRAVVHVDIAAAHKQSASVEVDFTSILREGHGLHVLHKAVRKIGHAGRSHGHVLNINDITLDHVDDTGTVGLHVEDIYVINVTLAHIEHGSTSDGESHVTYEGHVIFVEENTLEVHGATGIMNHGSAVHTTGVLDHQRKTSVVGTERHIFHVLHVAVLHVEHAGTVGLHVEDLYFVHRAVVHVKSTFGGHIEGLEIAERTVVEVDRSTRVEAHVTYEGHVIVVEENTLEVHGATGIMNHGSAVHTTGVLDLERHITVVGTERHVLHVFHVAVFHVDHTVT